MFRILSEHLQTPPILHRRVTREKAKKKYITSTLSKGSRPEKQENPSANDSDLRMHAPDGSFTNERTAIRAVPPFRAAAVHSLYR